MSASTSEVPEASGGSPQKRAAPLPPGQRKYKRVEVPSAEQIMQEEFMNNCAVRTVLATVMGSVMGVAFGVFMGTMDHAGMGLDGSINTDQKQTVRQAMKEMVQKTASRSTSYAKGFAAMGALFAGSECIIEKFRAKHDMYNSIYAGCTTGAVLAHSGGPKAMCIGCASFAAFSAVIDRFLEH